MNSKEVKRELEKYGDFLSVQQVAICLGIDRKTARKDILKGLEYIPIGQKKMYFKNDLVAVLMAKKMVD